MSKNGRGKLKCGKRKAERSMDKGDQGDRRLHLRTPRTLADEETELINEESSAQLHFVRGKGRRNDLLFVSRTSVDSDSLHFLLSCFPHSSIRLPPGGAMENARLFPGHAASTPLEGSMEHGKTCHSGQSSQIRPNPTVLVKGAHGVRVLVAWCADGRNPSD